MLKKVALLLAAIIILSCSQALAANTTTIFNGDEKVFVNAYNDLAKKLGLTTYKMPSKPDYSDPNGDLFSVDLTKNAENTLILIHLKDNAITKCGMLTDDKALAEKTFTAWLKICGLTDAEINVEPVFNADETTAKLYCAALKGNVNVTTSSTEDDKKQKYYTLIITGDEKK